MSARRLAYDILSAPAAPAANLWVVDAKVPKLVRINGTNPASPSLVATIDLTTFPGGSTCIGARSVATDGNYIFVAPFLRGSPSGVAPIVIVNPANNSFIGLASIGGNAHGGAFAFDGAGHVFASGQDVTTAVSVVYKYSIASILAAYPSEYASPIATFSPGNHIEQLTFGGGFLWASTGNNTNVNTLVRMDPTSGSATTYSFNGTGQICYGCLYAFGSVWTTSTNNKIHRFDPSIFPSAPTDIVIDASATHSNSCELAADASTIWVTNGSNFVADLPFTYRVSTGLGSEMVIAGPSAGNTSTTQGIVFSGSTIWTTMRYGSPVGLASWSTGLGTEAFIQVYNPGGVFSDPRAVCSL